MDFAKALVNAVDAGDVSGARAALRAGASPDATSPGFYKTPVLTTAARQGAAEIVAELLAAGAAPDASSGSDEGTPMRAAAMSGHARVVRLLIAAGAEVNPPSGRGSVLGAAVESTRHRPSPGAVETVGVLLDAGAVVRPQDDPAVIRAVAAGVPTAVVRLLLARGADPDARRSDGAPAIVIAAMRRDARLVDELLAHGADVDATGPDGRTALMHAVERGAEGIVVSLLCAGADKDKRAADGSSAAALARAWGRQVIRHMMGEQPLRREVVDAHRTVVYQRAAAVQLVADQSGLDRLAMLIDHAIDNLSDGDFRLMVMAPAEEGRRVAARLRHDSGDGPDPGGPRQIVITREEQLLISGALAQLAYGPQIAMPPGMMRFQIADISEDFEEFLR